MIPFKKILRLFQKSKAVQPDDILFPGVISEKQFASLEPKSRMQAVMIVGDEGDVKFYRFLKWCVEHDLDLDVRLAALKRLPNFRGRADLPHFLERLDKSPGKSELEPYLSMTLSRVGLINDAELNSRLNGSTSP